MPKNWSKDIRLLIHLSAPNDEMLRYECQSGPSGYCRPTISEAKSTYDTRVLNQFLEIGFGDRF